MISVYKQAQKIGITQPHFDAKYVKRPRLKDYLPANILKLEHKNRNSSRSDSSSSNVASGNEASSNKLTSKSDAPQVVSEATLKQSASAINLIGEQAEIKTTLLRNESIDSYINNVSCINEKECISSSSDSNDAFASTTGAQKRDDTVIFGLDQENPTETLKNQLISNVNSYDKATAVASPATQIDRLSLEPNDDISNRINLNNKRSVSPTQCDLSLKMPHKKLNVRLKQIY